MNLRLPLALATVSVALLFSGLTARAAEQQTIHFGDDLKTEVPSDWIVKRPRVRIIAHEFEVPGAEGDAAAGRVTVMQAGGSIEQNIERWFGQFVQPDGSKTAEQADVDKLKVAEQTVYVVDVSGTYRDQRGPFAPATLRPKYRMLAAIIPTDAGNWFVKFYGPEATVSDQADAFRAMIKGIERVE